MASEGIIASLPFPSQSLNPPSNDKQSLIFMDEDPKISIADIDGKIATVQKSLSLHPRSHPMYSAHVQILAMARFARHTLSQQNEDLGKSILHYTEAIFLRLPPMSRDGPFLNPVKILCRLALTLLKRSEAFEQPEGIRYAMDYLRHIRRFPLDSISFDFPKTLITASLIRALQTQINLGAGNGTQDIKEMVVLCNELLSSNKSENIPAAAFSFLDEAVTTLLESNHRFPTEMLDEVIECLRDAVKVCPLASYKVMNALAHTLGIRFVKIHSKEDYEEASLLLERILELGGCPDSFRVVPLSLVIVLALARSIFFREPEYFEVAICRLHARLRARLRAKFSSPSIDEELRLRSALNLAIQTRLHFREQNLDESPEEANTYILHLVNASSSLCSEELAERLYLSEAVLEIYLIPNTQQKIEGLEKLLSITPSGTERHRECLNHLERLYKSRFLLTNNILDIEESIKYSRLSLDASHSSDWRRCIALNSLCDVLRFAFDKTRKISYLDESITIRYVVLECKISGIFHFFVIQELVSSLLTRERFLGRIEDRLEAIRLMSMVIDNEYGPEPSRFELSCQWAIVARGTHHPTTLAAYKSAMSIMERFLSFAPTLSVQHSRSVTMGRNCQTMPLDYASYQIYLGRFEEAVETLERGRALLWSHMRGFRIPMAQLIKDDLSLAEKFADLNQELEALTISVALSGRPEIEDSVTQGREGTDPLGRLVIMQKKLVEERDSLISQIQSRLRLEGFLRAPSYTTLRSAASRGPVVIVNHCEWRSDIMVIFHNFLPCSIPTPKTFFARATNLRDELVKARMRGLDSKGYQDALCSVLKGLYELVGEPVIKRLRLLGVPEQSRIWWCPTSVFCSLPLHAMGPIPSSEPGKPRYFSDLYIPSYTSSLSALIDSRRPSARTLEKPSLLLVAEPDDYIPGVTGEIKIILERALKARIAVTGLVSSRATPSFVLEGLRGSQLAHFACHGVLETGKPFKASFELHESWRLTLLEIVRSRLPDAEFAFLSCCHAAEITAESASDEALHLTAAMQYCGFRSVVGTMWEMADTDGRDLAENFYQSLFSNQDPSVPYYERSAKALRDATQKLRGKRGISLERWVNFVHYGA